MSTIESNNSDEQVLGKIELFTGIASLPVIMINPDKATLEAAGYKPKEEPVYTGIVFKQKAADGITDVEVTRNKIVFYCKGKENVSVKGEIVEMTISCKREFLVSTDFDIAKTGTLRFININGQATYSKDLTTLQGNPKMAWFKPETARQAYVGEADLMTFVREWMNVANNNACAFDNIVNVLNGNIKELNDLLKQRPTNRVTQLLGVTTKDGKSYQAVYTKCTSRPTASSIAAKFHQELSGEYGEFKNATFQNSYELKLFSPTVNAAQPDSEIENDADVNTAGF